MGIPCGGVQAPRAPQLDQVVAGHGQGDDQRLAHLQAVDACSRLWLQGRGFWGLGIRSTNRSGYHEANCGISFFSVCGHEAGAWLMQGLVRLGTVGKGSNRVQHLPHSPADFACTG